MVHHYFVTRRHQRGFIYHAHTTIVRLLDMRSPATIFGGIASVVVNAINRFLRRHLAHVGEEIIKFRPSRADRDTSVTIERIVSTAADHRVPNRVGSGFLLGLPGRYTR